MDFKLDTGIDFLPQTQIFYFLNLWKIDGLNLVFRLNFFPYFIEVSAYFDFSWFPRQSAHASLLKTKKIANPMMQVKGNLVN